ncbi:MAG TPA: SRPBCC family protein [Acidimicrobiales bacterium]|nr:SRPBCC family protein [Acidimicrobiales bacterium]
MRRHVVIHRPAAEVWSLVGRPDRIHEWFPGITSCRVDGEERVVVTGAGVAMAERILTDDPLLRRFQYRITAPLFRDHLSTLDVIELDAGSCMVVYGVDAEPAPLALVIAGAAGEALANLRQLMEGGL